ncbi:formate dehydrogenase subunit delta [Limnobacter sp.]|uniref:formate dehydrogenase subunit delta n=1 Tax=Limnobacter sp. TaxID=2003368 RepID=UPI0025876AC4|nr:formate dehydrogenase subunit delta [Limnobacter sp.]
MNLHSLIDMANQIGDFFSTMPDAEEASMGIATHISKFWEPRMRKLLMDAIAADEAVDLLPSVKSALLAHADLMKDRRVSQSA